MHGLCRALLVTAIATATFTASFGGEIINGKKAKKNSLQYMVSVQVHGKHICGGFLIGHNFVLTAASCNDTVSVVLGFHNLKGNGKENPQPYKVKKIRRPDSYKEPRKGDNIMLLELPKKVKVTKVGIPKKDKLIKANSKCLVAGWGRNATDSRKDTVDDLLYQNVRTVNLQTCEHQWKDQKFTLPPNIICAVGDKNAKDGVCEKDMGGPLVCDRTAVGIVSFNSKRCDHPTVFTQISKYIEWINSVINGKS
ncbi:granzyme B(G,H)-like [Chanos chanos]|uniref:trypsin n=1 Tax=Chanos chanos TaxID=29144 RepID=A0A6J2W870_CHACN|nr:granzyme B(G,H)-like [Chanos chanos]